MQLTRVLLLSTAAIVIYAGTPVRAAVEDFAPPFFRGSPLTVTVSWSFAHNFEADPLWIWPHHPTSAVGDGIHDLCFWKDWAEAWGGTHWRTDPAESGDGIVLGGANLSVLRAWVSNYQGTGLKSTLHIQIRYGGGPAPFVSELTSRSEIGPNEWSETTSAVLLLVDDDGAGERLEVWLLESNPGRQEIEIEIPEHSWVDDLIVDTALAANPVGSARSSWGRLKSLYER